MVPGSLTMYAGSSLRKPSLYSAAVEYAEQFITVIDRNKLARKFLFYILFRDQVVLKVLCMLWCVVLDWRKRRCWKIWSKICIATVALTIRVWNNRSRNSYWYGLGLKNKKSLSLYKTRTNIWFEMLFVSVVIYTTIDQVCLLSVSEYAESSFSSFPKSTPFLAWIHARVYLCGNYANTRTRVSTTRTWLVVDPAFLGPVWQEDVKSIINAAHAIIKNRRNPFYYFVLWFNVSAGCANDLYRVDFLAKIFDEPEVVTWNLCRVFLLKTLMIIKSWQREQLDQIIGQWQYGWSKDVWAVEADEQKDVFRRVDRSGPTGSVLSVAVPHLGNDYSLGHFHTRRGGQYCLGDCGAENEITALFDVLLLGKI